MRSINLKGILKDVNTILILAIIPVLFIVIVYFTSFSWIKLWTAWLIGYAGLCLNMFATWMLLLWASDNGIIPNTREFPLKGVKVIIITLFAVIVISSIMVPIVPLEISVMAPIIMTIFICIGGLGAYGLSTGILADLEME